MIRRAVGVLAMVATCLAAGGGTAVLADDSPGLLEQARQHSRSSWRWSDRKQTLTMTIVDGRGNERTRKLRMFTRREDDGSEKSLAVFLEPADVRGTAFLQHTSPNEPSLQWLYLPELGRSRQITSSARRKSFMGTDFSYADLDLIENVLRWEVPSEAVPGPNDAADDRAWFELDLSEDDRGYDRVDVGLGRANAWMHSLRLYEDRDADPTKVLAFEGVRLVGAVPTAERLRMTQPATGSFTLVTVSDLAYDSGVADDLFTKRALERGLDHVD